MGGVDRADQKASYGLNFHRNLKWWKKAFFHMLQVAVVNAGVIFKAFHNPKRFHANKFRLSSAQQLLVGYERQSYRTGSERASQNGAQGELWVVF